MRRVTEEEARRAFAAAKRALRQAEEARARAEKLVAQSLVRLRNAESPGRRAAAGRLADREWYVSNLRQSVDEARVAERRAARVHGAAELSYEKSRAGLEAALRAREAAEAHRAQTRATERRLRARREESATGDRWRKK